MISQTMQSVRISKQPRKMFPAQRNLLRSLSLAIVVVGVLLYSECQIEAIGIGDSEVVEATGGNVWKPFQVPQFVNKPFDAKVEEPTEQEKQEVLVIDEADFKVEEATVQDIQDAFKRGTLTSRRLVELYLARIAQYNPTLHSVIEINPDVWRLADEADGQRKKAGGFIGGLHGVPVLLKDSIATKDRLNTTAGSYALLGSVVPRDAGVVAKLRKAGAIILGKANLSEWANFRSSSPSNGWSARGGQTKSPYVLTADPCGSSSGSAVSTAANLVAVSLGTETDGSIFCPSGRNAVVGIKPSVGLTSRAGVVPISHNQDTIGPICRTVADAVEVLDVIVGPDALDEATSIGQSFIPEGGYKQFLNIDGLRGKRLGVLRNPYYDVRNNYEVPTLDGHLQTMRKLGAVVIDNVSLEVVAEISQRTSEKIVILYDFKQDLNAYLSSLIESTVRSLADVIEFNAANAELEKLDTYDQQTFQAAQNTTGFQSEEYRNATDRIRFLVDGVRKLFTTADLDAVIGPSVSGFASIAAIGGYPGISVPAGYDDEVPFGITFIGVKGSEPKLIEIAYAFEQATHVRKSPEFLSDA